MNLVVHSGNPLTGETALPGDKSLSHRAALFAALAEGESQIENFLESGVTAAMLRALGALGVPWQLNQGVLHVTGSGLQGFQPPLAALDCGNSATTLRLLAGALAASGISAVLDGSAGLRRRPMQRIVAPLQEMGVPVEAAPGGGAPLRLEQRAAVSRLRALYYRLPVASAQVKTCLMLAGLAADGTTTLVEPELSRDHSERMLHAMGAAVWPGEESGCPAVTIEPLTIPLRPLETRIPGDFSAAAFLVVAALITPGSQVTLRGVGLNPTRTGLLAALCEMGADIQVLEPREQSGEPVGDLLVRYSRLRGTAVNGQRVVDMIDEFPVFAVAAAFAEGTTEVCGAAELRYKESDRITMVCTELQNQGASIEEHPDGFVIHGKGELPGGGVTDPHGDHRLAMALAVAGLAAFRPVIVRGAGIMAESFPGYTGLLNRLGARLEEKPGATSGESF